jgi:hypothetical protein
MWLLPGYLVQTVCTDTVCSHVAVPLSWLATCVSQLGRCLLGRAPRRSVGLVPTTLVSCVRMGDASMLSCKLLQVSEACTQYCHRGYLLDATLPVRQLADLSSVRHVRHACASCMCRISQSFCRCPTSWSHRRAPTPRRAEGLKK